MKGYGLFCRWLIKSDHFINMDVFRLDLKYLSVKISDLRNWTFKSQNNNIKKSVPIGILKHVTVFKLAN